METVEELYKKHGSVTKLSKLLNINRNKLSKELKALGVSIAPVAQRKDVDVLKMKVMYLIERMSLSEIAEEFGVERRLVSYRLKELGVEIRFTAPKNFPQEVYQDWAEQYQLDFSYEYIGKQYEVSKETVRYYLQNKMGIPSRASQKIFKEETYLIWVELYEHGASLQEIADQFDVSISTVAKHLEIRGIERRNGNTFTEEIYDEWTALYKAGFTTREIASLYGVSKFPVTYHLKRKGVRMRENWEWNLSKPHLLEAELSYEQKQLVIASAMGDGTLYDQAMGAYLRMKHKEGQREYLEYKKGILGGYIALAGMVETETDANGKTFEQVYVCSVPNMYIKKIRTLTYCSGVRVIRDIIPLLDSLGLAILWCDDGHYMKKKMGKLFTLNFSWEDNELLAAHMSDKFGIECYVSEIYSKKYNKKYQCIYITVEGMKQMIEVISPYVPSSMRYKLGEL
ncbi:hypothetical protein [Metabacillus elymi]|uniref:Homing endonuclease LAGLIDADG domain-containing protein n=1 Tax=Metabacillus elymi TaxID=2745198 RepID=A0ABX6S508_9BACI|nr:hypothetical protein [Metabacillus sp. KUDC1714]QNF28521.1 hypothetical protein HUW50_14155 [Metabacillus sp. KUDC1714]